MAERRNDGSRKGSGRQGQHQEREGNRREYYGGPQDGYGRAPEDYYDGPQDSDSYDRSGEGYYDEPRGGYERDPQGYYGDPRGSRGRGRESGYGDPRDGYGREPQDYYDGPQGYYEEPRRPGKKKKKKHRKLMFVLELLVLLVLGIGLFAATQLNRIDRVKLKDILVNAGLSGEGGYRNIALFGVDSREGQLEGGTNSDTIMVASINEKTGDVKLVSVYRDTYLDNTNGEYRKATECFAGGGAERSVNMLNKNLDLDIKDFMTVDFNAIIELVDLLGGIDIEITEEERGWLNGYLVETSQVTGIESYEEVQSAGMNHLNGLQAMAYCRIRYTEGWDFKRTERQRTVLGKILDKAKEKGITALIPMVTTMMPYVSTSLSNTELLSLASQITRYNIQETTGFPFNQQAANISAGDCVVPVNLAANVAQLHAYLFGDEDYTPSQTVQEISNKIISDTGIQ